MGLTILVVKVRALGDSIMGLGALQYLKEVLPQAKIIYGVPSWVAPIYQNVETACDDVLPMDFHGVNNIINTVGGLLNLAPDMIIELHQSGSSGKILSAYGRSRNIPYYFHNHHLKSGEDQKVAYQGVTRALIQRDLDGIWSHLFKDTNLEIPDFLKFTPIMKMKNSFIDKIEKKQRLFLGITATRETKLWGVERFVELAKKVMDFFPGLEIVVPLSKSYFDEELCF